MSEYGISCEYHMTSILLELSTTSWRCTEASEKEVYGRSYNFPWDPLDYVEIPVKRKSVGNPETSTGTLWVMLRSPWSGILKEVLGLPMRPSLLCGYPREEKYNGRIYDFTWDTLDCMEASLKRKLMENPGTVWRSLWREVLWDFPWDPLGCVMASVGNQWDILRLPNKILWTTPFFI